MALIVLLALAACTSDIVPDPPLAATAPTSAPPLSTDGSTATSDPGAGDVGAATSTSALTATTTTAPAAGATAPEWLGQRVLPTLPTGRVVVPQTTPGELRDRRFTARDLLPPPADGRFAATIEPVGPEVLARSTWKPGCPVEPEDLAYLTVSFWGFDDRPHTGELLVHGDEAAGIVGVFEELYDARFPIEEMRIVTLADLDAPPTGDGNNTTGFVCRAVTGGSSFSEHASGLAIDINPFHNPYERDDLILPELAGHYLDRSLDRPGMILDTDTEADIAVAAFARIGWSWGGDWQSLKDYQHFSRNGR